jgi:cytochrome c-type biogenesis protein CcmH
MNGTHRFAAWLLAAVVTAIVIGGPVPAAMAIGVDAPMSDPELEARARMIHKQLRCLVCQNQSIDDSNADLARDLRILVRERIAAGDSDQAAIDYIVARYGDWVLLDPPFKSSTAVLWMGPAALLVIGFVVVITFVRRQRRGMTATPAPLSDVERKRLEALLDNSETRAP